MKNLPNRLPDHDTFTAMLDAAGIKYASTSVIDHPRSGELSEEYQALAVAVRSGPNFTEFFFTPAGRFIGFVTGNEESGETSEFWGQAARP
jgi:hypothetical protein